MHAVRLDPKTLLSLYAQGAFPMADSDGVIRLYTADPRGIIPLDDRFHVPKTLQQLARRPAAAGGFEIRVNHNFEATMRACMNVRRDGTWISDELIAAYVRLHRLGFAHSVEAWRNDQLAGGLYGVSLGGAFFGESMFHHERDASKIALIALVNRLRERGFMLLDAQAQTAHLSRFGCIEVNAADYMTLLDQALERECEFV